MIMQSARGGRWVPGSPRIECSELSIGERDDRFLGLSEVSFGSHREVILLGVPRTQRERRVSLAVQEFGIEVRQAPIRRYFTYLEEAAGQSPVGSPRAAFTWAGLAANHSAGREPAGATGGDEGSLHDERESWALRVTPASHHLGGGR